MLQTFQQATFIAGYFILAPVRKLRWDAKQHAIKLIQILKQNEWGAGVMGVNKFFRYLHTTNHELCACENQNHEVEVRLDKSYKLFLDTSLNPRNQ